MNKPENQRATSNHGSRAGQRRSKTGERIPQRLAANWQSVTIASAGLLVGCIVASRATAQPSSQSGLLGSLAFLPFMVIVALLARGHHGRHHRSWDLFLFAPILAGAGLLHHRLAIPGSERLVAAALYLFAAIAILRTLPSLVRALKERAGAGWQFFVLPLALFAMLAPWTTSQRVPDGDEPWYLLITHSLVHDQDDDLANNYAEQSSLAFMDRPLEPQPGDPVSESGEIRSRHGMLLPLFLTPAYLALGYPGAVAMMILLSSLLCWFTASTIHLTLGRTSGKGSGQYHAATVMAWAMMALTAPLLLFSYQIWVEVPAGLLLLLGYRQFQQLLQRGPSSRSILILLCTFILLPALKLRFGLLAASLAALVALRSRLPRRQVGLLAAASAAALLGVLTYNQIVFGNPLRIHQWRDLIVGPSVRKLLGLFYDNAFGLFIAAPLWIVVLPGVFYLWRLDKKLTLNIGVLMTPSILLVTTRMEWYAGWSPPFRYLVALLPLFAILAAAAFTSRRGFGARILMPPLLLLSAGAGALWTAVPGWTYNFANGTSYWIDQWTRLSGIDWMRIVPSAVRPSGASLVVPLILTFLVTGLWIGLASTAGLKHAKALGLALALLSIAVPTALVRHLATTYIEAESALVTKTGGHPEPRQWTNNRTRFREGWTLRHGERLEIPVHAGGSRLTLQFAHRLFRNRSEDLLLAIYADDQKIGEIRLHQPNQWHLETVGPFDWPEAQSLILEAGPPLGNGQPGIVNGVAIDFLTFSWS